MPLEFASIVANKLILSYSFVQTVKIFCIFQAEFIMSRRNSYRTIISISYWIRLVAAALILSITAKPVIKMVYHLMDIKLEIYEAFEEDDSEEKKFGDDIEKEPQEFNSVLANNAKQYAREVNSTFVIHRHFKDYIPDILIPPPQFS